jgi:hypothetical protein
MKEKLSKIGVMALAVVVGIALAKLIREKTPLGQYL